MPWKFGAIRYFALWFKCPPLTYNSNKPLYIGYSLTITYKLFALAKTGAENCILTRACRPTVVGLLFVFVVNRARVRRATYLCLDSTKNVDNSWDINVSFIIHVNFDHAWVEHYPVTLTFILTVFMLIERMIQLPQVNSISGIVCILLEWKCNSAIVILSCMLKLHAMPHVKTTPSTKY